MSISSIKCEILSESASTDILLIRTDRTCGVVSSHLLPHGGYDMTTLTGDLRLSISVGDEPFQPLGSTDASAEKTKKGEIVYRDDVRVLTRAFNHRDCEPTKIADETTEFVIIIEDTSGTPNGAKGLENATEDLKGLYEEVFGKMGDGEGAFSGQTVVWEFKDGTTEWSL